MKKLFVLLLVGIMMTIICACEGPVGTGEKTTAEKKTVAESGETEAEAEAGKFDGMEIYEFNLSIHDPSTSNNGKFYQAWADDIEAATEGHVKIHIFYSAQLAAPSDVADMVESGGVDIGWVFTAFYAGQFPLSDVTTFPFIGFGDAVVTAETLWDLYDEYPELQEEWSAYKLLFMYGNPGNIFASTKGEVTSPDGVKNQVMRTPAGPITDLMKAMGGSPTVMGPGDMFDAIQKGVISGFVFEPAGITNFSLQDAAKMYYTDYPMYNATFALVMNWDKWNSLPEELQQVIEEKSGRAGSILAAQDFQDAADASKKTIEDAGNTWVELTEDQIKVFKEAAEPINQSWIDKYTTADFDYAAYAARAAELLKEYSK
ncbi:MAG: TRAP transporter substrate-binding protein [Lachnospiraceae bacterium]|jgi:TRAP-type C4-dicarboxylate transport system substrate-binding protein